MNLPVAPAPVAVLVLAWDETTPAARVLVETTDFLEPPLDSVVALVPTGPAADELSQEEFWPLEASLDLPAPVELQPEPPTEITSTEAVAEHPPLLATEASPASVQPAPMSMPAVEATPPLSATALAAALVKPALVWQEIRVLRFSSYPSATMADYSGPGESANVWQGVPIIPAAPYLGSSAPAFPAQGNAAATTSAVATNLAAGTATVASALVAVRTLAPPSGTSGSLTPASSAKTAALLAPNYLPTEMPAAPDAESDAAPALTPNEPAPTAEASTTELGEAATVVAPLPVDGSPVQQAEPTPPPAPASPVPPVAEPVFFAPVEATTEPQFAALRPASQPFDAPNLNFQIIQYARLAVPQALAEQPFGVLYAPAWPTWLAAQELRQRTGQPLVLHLAQLAAAEGEPLDLAAGWVAELQRQALHHADLILTETPALAQRLRRELALPTHRVRPVPAADVAAVAQALRTAQRQ